MKKKLAIFASGAGSNAQQLINHFRNSPSITIRLVVSDKPGAGVTHIAEKEGIELAIIDKSFQNTPDFLHFLQKKDIDFIILAGFLKKIPAYLISAYPQQIINIHPALLPKYGGKGMYGRFVHDAVIAAGEKESGITIHFVDELYDHGAVIFQAACNINSDDTPDSLAAKIHTLEHRHFAPVIEKVVLGE